MAISINKENILIDITLFVFHILGRKFEGRLLLTCQVYRYQFDEIDVEKLWLYAAVSLLGTDKIRVMQDRSYRGKLNEIFIVKVHQWTMGSFSEPGLKRCCYFVAKTPILKTDKHTAFIEHIT